MAGGDLRAALKPHAMRVDDGRSFLDELGARPQEIGAIGIGQSPDFLVLGRDKRRPVELRLADAPAEPRRIVEVVGEAARVDVKLLRHAAADDASAADAAFLRHERLGPMAGGDARRPHPARSRADDEEIDVECHC